MRGELHEVLTKSEANRVPFSHKRSMGQNLRRKSGSTPAEFPEQLMREKEQESVAEIGPECLRTSATIL